MTGPPRRRLLAAGYLVLALVWGSTFLGQRFSVETIPPFAATGMRFATAGLLLGAVMRLRGHPLPRGRSLAEIAAVGAFMFTSAQGISGWVLRYTDSGLVATAYATIPLIVYLVDTPWSKRRYRPMPILGLVIGAIGVYLLSHGDGVRPPAVGLGTLLIMVYGSSGWAIGSVIIKQRTYDTHPLMMAAVQMTAGGTMMCFIAAATNEFSTWDIAATSARSIWATVYLVTFGTILTYSTYVWLLKAMEPSKVATYALLNPVVALVLGSALAGETFTETVYVAVALVIGAVGLVLASNMKATKTPAPPVLGVVV